MRARPDQGATGQPLNRAGLLGSAAIYTALVLAALWFLAPFWVMLATSLKPDSEIANGNIFAWPHHPSLAAWAQAWRGACAGLQCAGLQAGFVNSLEILAPSLVVSVLLGSWVAYGLSFWSPLGARALTVVLLFGAFAPYQIFTYPLVTLFSALRLYDSLACIVIVHVIFSLPITTFLFTAYNQAIPRELVQAADVDGASYWHIYRRIILPLSLPAFAIVSIFQTNGIWNDFFFGLVFAGSDHMPMTVELNNIVNTTTGERHYNVDMAATILTSAVPLLVSVASGKWFVRALTSGAVKA
jgi:glucose/mannose transport system permease protein